MQDMSYRSAPRFKRPRQQALGFVEVPETFTDGEAGRKGPVSGPAVSDEPPEENSFSPLWDDFSRRAPAVGSPHEFLPQGREKRMGPEAQRGQFEIRLTDTETQRPVQTADV